MRIVADIQNNSKIILWLLCPCYGIGLLCMVYATYYGGLRITGIMSNKDCHVIGRLFWMASYKRIILF